MAIIASRLFEIWFRQENLPLVTFPLEVAPGIVMQKPPLPCGRCGDGVTISRIWKSGELGGALVLDWVGNCTHCGVQSGQRITATPADGQLQVESSDLTASRQY